MNERRYSSYLGRYAKPVGLLTNEPFRSITFITMGTKHEGMASFKQLVQYEKTPHAIKSFVPTVIPSKNMKGERPSEMKPNVETRRYGSVSGHSSSSKQCKVRKLKGKRVKR